MQSHTKDSSPSPMQVWSSVPGDLAANSDATTLVKNVLATPILARYLR
jgi:hypothetical protein